MSLQPQVLIVGAGPAGLSAALVLRRNGVTVRIIEKALDHHIGVRGNGVQPRILELFKTLGVVDDILDNSTNVPPMRSYEGKTVVRTWEVVEKYPRTPTLPYSNVRVLSQATTEAILRSHAVRLGATVELGTELVDFKQDEEKVTAFLLKHSKDGSSTEETIKVDWMIGSDGARGITRKFLGIKLLGETLEEQAFLLADIEMEGANRDYWHVYGNASTGLVMNMPLGEAPAFAMFFNGTPEEIQKVVDGGFDAYKAYLDRIMKDDSLVLTKIIWMSIFRPNIRCADRFSVGRVFIAGDGAHVHSPLGAQGLNTAVQDAFNLAWKLALVIKDLAPRSLLSTYESERMPVIKEMLDLSTDLHTNSMSGKEVASKDALQPVNPGFKRSTAFRQLGVNYQWSEIVLDDRLEAKDVESKVYRPYGGGEDETIKAGNRAPDVPDLVPPRGGEPTTLFDLLTPATHTVLVFELPTDPPSFTSTKNIFQALGSYNKDGFCVIRSYLILSKDSSIATLGGDPAGAVDQILVDSEGHARTAYDVDATQSRQALPVVVIIRPDTYIGAFVHDADGVEMYFSKIFV